MPLGFGTETHGILFPKIIVQTIRHSCHAFAVIKNGFPGGVSLALDCLLIIHRA